MIIRTICPKCGGAMLETVLTSYPPQYRYDCQKCGSVFKQKHESFEVKDVPLDLNRFEEVI